MGALRLHSFPFPSNLLVDNEQDLDHLEGLNDIRLTNNK